MTDVTHRLILSVTEPNNNVGLLVVRQDDEATQKFSVELVENGEMKTFEGLTVEFVNATRINQGMPIISKVNDVYPDQGRFEYTLQSQDLQFVGQNSGYFNFKDADGKKIFSTRNFHFRVERGVYKGKIADGGYLWEITELIRLTNEWLESIKGIIGDDAAASLSAAIVDHVGNKKNPHGVTKAQIDLGNVPNYSVASESEAIDGTVDNKLMTPAKTKALYSTLNPKEYVVKYSGMEGIRPGDEKWRDDYYTEVFAEFRRVGNRVTFFCRAKWKKETGSGAYTVPTYNIPDGYRITTEWDNTVWNVPLAAGKYAEIGKTSVGGFAERRGTNLIRLMSNAEGNVYYSGEWVTDDPFPSVAGS